MSDGLKIHAVTVAYGGHVALDGVSLEASRGRITGLIGPNGAGKTSLFNVCSGLLNPMYGRVHLDGREITRLTPSARAQLGLGRTFQRMELYQSLTVRENIAMGREARVAGSRMLGQLTSSVEEREAIREAAAEATRVCGLDVMAGVPVSRLSTGERRLVELARTLAGGFDYLLLDEPSSGLDVSETARLGEILKHVTSEYGTGILLVEHDMDLVMGVSERIYVLDFGKILFEGTPSEVAASDVVRAAYLGTEELLDV